MSLLVRHLAGAVSGRLRRSLSTAASCPSWAMIEQVTSAVRDARAGVHLAEPPRVTELYLPEHLVNTGASPDLNSGVVQLFPGDVCSASGDGLLLLTHYDTRVPAPHLVKPGTSTTKEFHLTGLHPDHHPNVMRFVLNPQSGQLSRLPDIACNPPSIMMLSGRHMGLLTKSDRGHGAPDKYAVAELQGDKMLRYLSETESWSLVVAPSPCRIPPPPRTLTAQETLAFGGWLWWIDLRWGAVCADPFSDKLEPRVVELPGGSVLPAHTPRQVRVRRGSVNDQALCRYRRMGVSEGKMRYFEVSRTEPFLLSSFVLDEEGGGWTLEHRLALSRLWADGGYPWIPLQEGKTRS